MENGKAHKTAGLPLAAPRATDSLCRMPSFPIGNPSLSE